MGKYAKYIQGFIHPRWLAGLLPSTVGVINREIISGEREKKIILKQYQHFWDLEISHSHSLESKALHILFENVFLWKLNQFKVTTLPRTSQHYTSHETNRKSLKKLRFSNLTKSKFENLHDFIQTNLEMSTRQNP